MNRQVVVNATDAGGILGQQGHRLAYDLNGNLMDAVSRTKMPCAFCGDHTPTA
jgi:hypothetical protein